MRPELARGEPVRVAFAQNQAEAELVQNLLLEEGIPSMIRRSGGFDVPDFLAAGPRDVLVPADGAELARALLQEADLGDLAVGTREQREASEPLALRRHLLIGFLVAGGGFLTALVIWVLQETAR